MFSLTNIELFSVGLANSAIVILGFIVFFNERKSATNKAFLIFSLVAALWNTANYASTQITNEILELWVLRSVIFFAVWYCFFLYTLFYVFPDHKAHFSNGYKYIVFPAALFASFVTLSPFAFKSIKEFAPVGEVPVTENGPGMVIFGITVILLIIAASRMLLKKMRAASSDRKIQYRYILVGTMVTFSLYIVFNFILPVLFDKVGFIRLGAVFTLPIIVLTTYAIMKYGLLRIKIISTELLSFALVMTSFVEVLLSENLEQRIFRSFITILLLAIAIYLNRSVKKEVEQREVLSKLTVELQQKTQILEDLSSINNHQQRTPLTVIKGGIDMLEHSKLTKAQRQEIIDQMKNRVERMLHTLTEFSVGFSPKFKSVNVVPKKDNLEEAVRMIYDEHFELEKARQRRDPKYKKLEFVYEAPKEPLPPVWYDRNNVLHILSNLMDNAVSYSDTGTIRVSYGVDKDFAIVKIQDNGMGVTPEEKKIIFDKAKRSERAKKRYAFGSGLGLFLAKQIADESKGSLDVESKGVGKGSTFVLKLPLYKGQDTKGNDEVNKTL